MEDRVGKIIQTVGHGSLATTLFGGLYYVGCHFLNNLSRVAGEEVYNNIESTDKSGLATGCLIFGVCATIPLIYAVKSAHIAFKNSGEMLRGNNNYEPISLDDYALGDDSDILL